MIARTLPLRLFTTLSTGEIMRKIALSFFAIVALMVASLATAQTWPTKSVKVIVPLGAGGITDNIVRLAADDLTKRMGQPFLVDNRPGANGLIAARFVKGSAADGYTLFGGSATTFSSVFMKESIDAEKELEPVSIIAIGDWIIYVRPGLGVSSLKELAAKGKTTKLRFASPSTANHAIMSAVAKQMGFEYEEIPYKATDQTIVSLIAGDTDFTLNGLAGFTSMLQAGKLKVISTLGPTRSPILPDVQTAKEQGVDMVMRFNMGFWAPLGTPKDVIARLGQAVAEAVKAPAVVEKIGMISMIPSASSPEELLRAYQSEQRIYKAAAALVGLQPQ